MKHLAKDDVTMEFALLYGLYQTASYISQNWSFKIVGRRLNIGDSQGIFYQDLEMGPESDHTSLPLQ